jgi:hypothetical protein
MDISFDRARERLDAEVSEEFHASGLGAMQVVVAGMPPAKYRRSAFKAAIGSTSAAVRR